VVLTVNKEYFLSGMRRLREAIRLKRQNYRKQQLLVFATR